MSTNLIINESTTLRNDSAFYTTRDFNNNKISNYNFIPNISDKNDSRGSYISSVGIPGI